MTNTEDDKKQTIEIVCKDCNGTGLYVGMAERNGAAVICNKCNGTGCKKFTYTPFTERKLRKGIERVYENGHGYVIGSADITTEEGKTIHFSQYGCTYEEWLSGVKPIPIKELCCPYQHTYQELRYKDVNALYESRCSHSLRLSDRIKDCKLYKCKETCWEIYDKE